MLRPLAYRHQSMGITTHNNRPDLVHHRTFEGLRQSIKFSRDYPVTLSGTPIVRFIPW